MTISRGITTGHNDTFVISTGTKDALVAADPKSAEIIKPVLRGRDIQQYQAQWAGQWLIDTHNGYGDVPAIEIDDYPAVKSYLNRFYQRLKTRQDKGKTPYNLRNCAYYEDFRKEKLLWRRVASEGIFAHEEREMYCINAVYMMIGESLKYLCAVLNSRLTTWFARRLFPTSGTGTFHWEKVHFERLPIPKIDAEAQRPFIALVDRILAAEAADPQADTSEQEEEIDWLVYDLYDLSDEEVTVIADALWDGEVSEEEEDAALVRAIEAGLAEDDERFDISVAKEILSEISEGRI